MKLVDPEQAEQRLQTMDKLLFRPESVAFVLDIKSRTFRQWVAAEEFPPPDLRKGPKLVWWKAETVKAYVDREIEKWQQAGA